MEFVEAPTEMTVAQGKILRQVAILIEVLAMLGMLGLIKGKTEIWNGFPIDPAIFLKTCLGIGIAMWSVGTWVIYRKR